MLGESFQAGGLKIPKNNSDSYHSDIKIFMGVNFASLRPKNEPNFKHIKIYSADKPSFKQELIYNGRFGDNVNFFYI